MKVDRSTMKTLIEKDWNEYPRWKGIETPYTADEVVNLKGSTNIQYTCSLYNRYGRIYK